MNEAGRIYKPQIKQGINITKAIVTGNKTVQHTDIN
jgi:hypothetical protein